MAKANVAWWGDFWSRSFIHLHSADGVADEVERAYTYYLYVMGATSRGRFPTKFNGMLWATGGDTRSWGGQFWGANQSCYYNNALFAANQIELMDPMFDMYTGMIDSCARGAPKRNGAARGSICRRRSPSTDWVRCRTRSPRKCGISIC